jgi:hypothetical protein
MIQAISYHQNFAFIVILYRAIWSKVACVIFTLCLHSTYQYYHLKKTTASYRFNPLTFNTFSTLRDLILFLLIKLNYMLSDPFLGRKNDKFFRISSKIDTLFSILNRKSLLKIEFLHEAKISKSAHNQINK